MNLNSLGQVKVPGVLASLLSKGLVDSMNIVTDTDSQDDSGGLIDGTSSDDYENVPVLIEPRKQGYMGNQAERMVSVQHYDLMFANHLDGSRIDLDITKHRFTVLARGNEPQKIFLPVRVEDNGVYFVVVCTREN